MSTNYHHGRFSPEKESEILELYKQGMSQKEIGILYNTWNTSIRRVLLRHDVVPKGNDIMRSFIGYERFVGPELTREEQYWLGMLAADGCISGNTLTLGLKESDVYLLEKFAAFLGPKVKVCKYFHKAHGIYQYQVSVKNTPLCERLQSMVNFKNKSFECEFYTALTFDSLRGIIDGNGHVRTIKAPQVGVSICGASTKLLEQIKEFLYSYGITSSIIKEKSKANVYNISIYRQAEIRFLYENMYRDTDLYLTRKEVKYAPVFRELRYDNFVPGQGPEN